MSLEGWIFMVGLRVFDVGGLIVWLVWFFRQTDADDDLDDEDDPGRGDDPPRADAPEPPPGPPGSAAPWPARRRDHGDRLPLRRGRRVRRSDPPARPRPRTPVG